MQLLSLPHVDTARRFPRQRTPRPVQVTTEDGRQLRLFPPSVFRRVALRRRTVFRYRDIRGDIQTRMLLETVPVSLPRSSDDKDREIGRWTPPRHTRTFDSSPYLDDYDVRRFVLDHPEGASLGEIAEAIGWTKQGVMEVERRAIVKILRLAMDDYPTRRWMADLLGIPVGDITDAIAEMAERRQANADVEKTE